MLVWSALCTWNMLFFQFIEKFIYAHISTVEVLAIFDSSGSVGTLRSVGIVQLNRSDWTSRRFLRFLTNCIVKIHHMINIYSSISLHITSTQTSSCILHLLKHLPAYHICSNIFLHITSAQISSRILHLLKHLPEYHIYLNVSLYITSTQTSPCISHLLKHLPLYHIYLNVSLYITSTQTSPCRSHLLKYLPACHINFTACIRRC